MFADCFSGEVIINSETELIEFLKKRSAFNANQFILTFNENGFPQLNAFVKNDHCVLYFLETEPDRISASCDDNYSGTETVLFYENINGAEVELARDMVVSTKHLVEASIEFYKTKSRPMCINWMDL